MNVVPEQTVRLEPAYSLIKELGGTVEVADYIGISRKTVWAWQAKCGRKGKIPKTWHHALAKLGNEKDVDIPEEVFC